MPGQNRLVYIAGHRTTYLAPFSPRHELLRLQACHPRVLRHAAASSMHGS
jgi:sortase (surface protein transpeptidase)